LQKPVREREIMAEYEEERSFQARNCHISPPRLVLKAAT
jgi:hypothetical protein